MMGRKWGLIIKLCSCSLITTLLYFFSINKQPQAQPQSMATSVDSLDAHIRKILIPRVSGTPGNVQVRQYIVDILKQNNYHVELDEFTDSTPIGKVKFANIIGSSNPRACRQLVLACHYDSKMMDGFLGAIDSAVPCAMLLELAEKFSTSFRATDINENDRSATSNSLGIRFVFFDGEEAFVEWTSTDSLYGSRHLAAKWAKQRVANQDDECKGGLSTELKRIELLMVLDLIGSEDTSFVMYNRQLRHHYNNMQKYEHAYLLEKHKPNIPLLGIDRGSYAFKNGFIPLRFVSDDHVPFMERGVPCLSLLSNPFPKVWHTIKDNYEAIDFVKTRQIQHVIERFVANYK